MSPRHAKYAHTSESEIEHSSYGMTPYALILIALSVICFVGASIQNAKAGKGQAFTFAPNAAEQVATLKVEKPNTIYAVTVSQSPTGLANNSGWSDVAIIVRSEKGGQLLSFGGNFWRASGYDEGPWSEKKGSYTMKATFPIKGDYIVSTESSSSHPSYKQQIKVNFEPRRGSSLPLLILGIPALLVGVCMGYISNRRAVSEKLAEWGDN